jgi:hypothetical protein
MGTSNAAAGRQEEIADSEDPILSYPEGDNTYVMRFVIIFFLYFIII